MMRFGFPWPLPVWIVIIIAVALLAAALYGCMGGGWETAAPS